MKMQTIKRILHIDDSPHKVASGLGLGVFLGIIPGTGPIAAFILSSALRVNTLAALIGSLLTNTWLSVVTFALSIKLGSVIMRINQDTVFNNWVAFINNRDWLAWSRFSILKLVVPVALGYLVIALFLGFVTYLVTLALLLILKHEKNKTGTGIPGKT